jgi:hypothetical protein
MAHKLNQTNQEWKDAVDQGLVLSLDEDELALVDFEFWKRSVKSEPVRCATATRGGRETRADLRSTGELSKHGKRYVCLLTIEVCAPEGPGGGHSGTRHDPPLRINLKLGAPITSRHSTKFMQPR